ncbi:hypothetical protein [Sphingorhabdus sp. Alg239-R122]|uniref:hypothetical protein n=1 Tax=Sphingorhabdus sp. Alg239-R122 TaxID=2305989 RepID=UPI0013DBB31A|nr:hypothetical protein [Sphingorhabdus sp. Alg239-R122]
MNKRMFAVASLALSLSACVSSGAATRAPTASVPKQMPMQNTQGLEAVMGQDARGLARLFGEPRLDVREGDARKLQFSSRDCVLDTYLYPKGRGDAVVTYVDARTPDGRNADRASCVAALRR